MFNQLKILLGRKEQRFICSPAGNMQKEQCKFTAHITHEVLNPLDKAQLKEVEEQIGYQEQLFELLSNFGSVRLYCDTLSDNSAYYIAHPSKWRELYNDFSLWVNDLDDEEQEELLPKWLDDVIVIGEIPSSSNFYLYPIKGDEKGKVFQFEHDGFEFVEVGKDLESFIQKISTVTESLIEEILSYTRYSDGKTNIQWLAQTYEYDEK